MKLSETKKDIKFEELFNVDEWEIETPDGWKDIQKVGKTIPYTEWYLETHDGNVIVGADEHILFNGNGDEKFLKDFTVDDTIQTNNGNEIVKRCGIKNGDSFLGEEIKENMYDLQVDGHIYYLANGIKSHNTLCLSAFGEQLLKAGHNVLYLSAEISEEELKERFDGNILQTATENLPKLTKESYVSKIKDYIGRSKGRLVIKQYPTATANVLHVRALLDELEVRENFKPDFICLDYLNIFASIRYKDASNSYLYVKGIIEEFRGLAVEKNIGIFTATQTGRDQNGSSNMELGDVSESFGTAHTADFVLGIIETDDLKMKEQYLFKVLKSRYSKVDPRTQKFLMGVDKDSQRLYEVDDPRDGLITENADNSVNGSAPNLDNRDGKAMGTAFGTPKGREQRKRTFGGNVSDAKF